MSRPIILLEFNEIVPQLIERFIADGRLPHFAKFKEASDVFVTSADEPSAPYLEPWIQWYSIHTGLPYKEHGVYRLTDGLQQDHDDVWRMLSRQGKRVMNFSSMNARPFEAVEGSVYLPDPWCSAAPPHPPELQNYQNFVSRMVQEYTNASSNMFGLAGRFMTLMASHGLSFSTVRALTTQLVGEKLGSKRAHWQRVPLLDAMQFDLFKHFYKENKPEFATFFINSTAHYQHAYWRDMDPALFGDKQNGESAHKNAILYGYQCMDRLLEHFFKIERETGALLILSSALSQQPYHDAVNTAGRKYYRFHDIKRFLNDIDANFVSVEPVMTNQYRVHFERDEDAVSVAEKLGRIIWEGEQVIQAQHDHEKQLYIGIGLHGSVPETAPLEGLGAGDNRSFYDLFYQLDVTKSGRHHPDGVLWVKGGRHQQHTEKPSILDILPTILELQGIDPDIYSKLQGKSLVPSLGLKVDHAAA